MAKATPLPIHGDLASFEAYLTRVIFPLNPSDVKVSFI